MSTLRKTLAINGVEKMFICDPEVDTLADVLRRMGLTGTKVGCAKGQCGICSVILDGKVVRACTRKIRAVKDYSSVTTIEGLGTAENLHPLQLAWIVYGGVQCGFCTPGFIMSAKGLLDENQSPTRQEVRAWFQKHRNACRCTGYKPLVDAVMAAAKVLRGEITMEELSWKIPEDGRIYNTHIPRPAALSKVLGVCDYGDDIAMKMPDDTLYLAVVLPGCSHANILGIDTSEAEAAPGVEKVITSKDVKGINRITMPVADVRSHADGFEHPFIMDKKVFRYGDVVAAVLADTPRHAREAAKLVKLDLEPLPEYLNALDALAEDAVRVHPDMPNLFLQNPVIKGDDTRDVLDNSPYVAEGSFYSTRQPHLVLEPDTAQAYIDADGVLTIQCKSLGIYLAKATIAAGLGIDAEKIRIIENPTGASFGYTLSSSTAGLLGAATMAVGGRPVSMTLSYEEHQHFTGKRAASYSNARIGCDENGRLTGLEFDIAYDKGPYTEVAGQLIQKALRFFGAPYYIPNIRGLAKDVFTNHSYSTAYRGFGSPQVYTASEQLMDMLAEKIGMDPFEFRYKNVYRPGETNNTGTVLSVYPMQEIFDKIRPKYEMLKERAKKLSTDKKKRGVGVACGHYNVTGNAGEYSEVSLELNPDGSVTTYNSWEDQGQGADVGTLVHVHECLRPLGITVDQIKLVQNDTQTCPPTGPAASSRSHYMAGNATLDAATKLMDAMRKPDGSWRTYDEMVAENIPTKYLGSFSTADLTSPMDPNTAQGNPTPEYTYGVFICEVEVDVDTGKTKVIAMHGVADIGVVGNYLAVDGQAYGGMMHTIGFALTEDYQDLKKHKDLMGSGFPYIEMIPDGDDFTIEYVETPRASGPHGSSGCSELFQSGGHISVINAIYDAVGVRIYDLPATPEKVKAALEEKAIGKHGIPEKYYLGGDFYETIDDMIANPVEPKK
ncbi:molybdopterin-dependent oxidoreductase [Christensenellaceae bacterium OttesenSCG-928-K19]|nr:molybdopterin-dependent oxidoreductase [Christensenellaceae bacterium OttesenSCG-928-K19]